MSPLFTYNNKLLVVDGKLATDENCCCEPCTNEQRFFPGFTDANTWFKSSYWYDEDTCYFQLDYQPDGRIKVSAVEPDDPNIPPGENFCGLFKVVDGTNWFIDIVPIGTYVRRGDFSSSITIAGVLPVPLGDIWEPPVGKPGFIIIDNTTLVFDAGGGCNNFGDKIKLILSDPV